MHILEVQRFIEIIEKSTIDELKKNKLLTWMKFFTSKNLKAIEKELMEANPIMTKVIEEYKRFTSDDKLMRAYDARDAFLLGQKMMLNREREEGIKERMEKGIKKGKLEGEKNKAILMATAMKKDGADIKLISKYTGLTIKEIKKL